MKRIITIFLICFQFQLVAQMSLMDAPYKKDTLNIAYKIDTTNQRIASLYHFINDYMNQDSISKKYWNPKYKNTTTYNYNYFIDGIWRSKTPTWIRKSFYVKLVELDTINDTLAYFKMLVFSDNDTANVVTNFSSIYKYYIVKIKGKYYIDNCKEYESRNFFSYRSKNIHFYCSPFLKNDTMEMIKASDHLDDLCKKLNVKPPDSPFDYYMCSNEGEMSILCNIVTWDGRVGGFTNMDEKFVVSISDKVFYQHEFIHLLLGKGAPCFFLGEGIASYYGGLSQQTSYQEGLKELRECYKIGKCNFDDLLAMKISNLRNSNPRYTFAAAFCQYLIDTIGLKKFYELYYNKDITTANFLEKVEAFTHKSKEEIKNGVEKIILGK